MKFIRVIFSLMFLFSLFPEMSYAGSSLNDFLKEQPISPERIFQFQTDTSQSDFQSPPPSKSKFQLDVGLLHKVLGYSTLVLAGVAAFTGSDDPDSTHHNSSVGAAALGVMTVATGFYEYGDMFVKEDGFSTTNIHIVLGTLGAVGFAAGAILASTDSTHSALGVGSAIAMGGALIVIPW